MADQRKGSSPETLDWLKWLSARTEALDWGAERRAEFAGLFDLPGVGRRWNLDRLAERAAEFFTSVTDDERRTLWRLLFPHLADACESAWLDAGQRVIRGHYCALSFRAPRDESSVAYGRARFFLSLCRDIGRSDLTPETLASRRQWHGHVWWDSDAVPTLLAHVLRRRGAEADAIRVILKRAIDGENPDVPMGTWTLQTLLNSDQRQDWEVVGRLLLAAQRQEGLRQSILDVVDTAHPDAFRFMLDLIIEHDLGRFSSVVSTFDVWFRMCWTAGSATHVHDRLRLVRACLDDPGHARAIVASGPADDTWFALWSLAFRDVSDAIVAASVLLEDPEPERRFVAVTLLARAHHPEACPPIFNRISADVETDDRVLMAMLDVVPRGTFPVVDEALFEALARLFDRIPARRVELKPIVWPWAVLHSDRSAVAGAMVRVASSDPVRIIPWIEALEGYLILSLLRDLIKVEDAYCGEERLRRLRETKFDISPVVRQLLLKLMPDRRVDVHTFAFHVMYAQPLFDDEVEVIVSTLHRSAATLRKAALTRLAKLEDDRLIAMIEHLLGTSHARKQAAGVELATLMISAGRSSEQVSALLAGRVDDLKGGSLKAAASRTFNDASQAPVLDDCFGLLAPGTRCAPIEVRFRGVQMDTVAAMECLCQIRDLFLQHAETEVTIPRPNDAEETMPLGATGWMFPVPSDEGDVREEARTRLLLAEIWLDWLNTRGPETRDPDGLELLRAWCITRRGDDWERRIATACRTEGSLDVAVRRVTHWLALLSEPQNASALLIQWFEDGFFPKKVAKATRNVTDARVTKVPMSIHSRCGTCLDTIGQRPDLATPSDLARIAALSMRAMEEHGLDGPRLAHFVHAFDQGLLNEHDFVFLLVAPKPQLPEWQRFSLLEYASGLHPPPGLAARPSLLEAARRVRDRVVDIELARGDISTVASAAVSVLHHSGGADIFFSAARALGRESITRHHECGETTRSASLSHIIAVTTPAADDTPERFSQLCEASGLRRARLVELAMFAPQWASHFEYALERPGLEDAIWWVHAHTKGAVTWRRAQMRELWAARINERTELEADDLEEGAVDVAWFRRIIDRTGAVGWDELQKPARFACDNSGHKRAQLFAEAMLNRQTADALLTRINDTRHQDAVRALGLVPLPLSKKDAAAETLRRYTRLQEFRRESRKFGSQRQASEGRAVDIGLENLARTAGYRDPRRLQWAMEAHAVADLADGPITIEEQGTTLSLAIDNVGSPVLTITNTKGRQLKAVPAKIRKVERVAELRAAAADLRKQRARMRLALEESMCRGDLFTRTDLCDFHRHPILRPMIADLVFIGDGNLIGYPEDDANTLRRPGGQVEPIGTRDTLRLAHPIDLLDRGDWSDWQQECFDATRTQPFRQVFREVYPLTTAEREQGDFSQRYSGHQVNPGQALSLLKSRRWVFTPEEGVRRVWHEERIFADLWFEEHFFTPSDVEGLTLDGVAFRRRGDHRPLRLRDVPPRIFSETMRDLDLVVSVAHAGAVDPEASASTVEMRRELVRQTCRLLNLANVRITDHHAVIDGTRASYSVHLGSGTVHLLPARYLCIIPVHSQHRGRVFLPFADDDPRTAELLSKIQLLARDKEIKDPSILEQIHR